MSKHGAPGFGFKVGYTDKHSKGTAKSDQKKETPKAVEEPKQDLPEREIEAEATEVPEETEVVEELVVEEGTATEAANATQPEEAVAEPEVEAEKPAEAPEEPEETEVVEATAEEIPTEEEPAAEPQEEETLTEASEAEVEPVAEVNPTAVAPVAEPEVELEEEPAVLVKPQEKENQVENPAPKEEAAEEPVSTETEPSVSNEETRNAYAEIFREYEEEEKQKKQRPARKIGRILGIIVVILALLVVGCYGLDQLVLQRDTFLVGTTINGVDVSDQTPNQAVQTLTDAWNQKTLKITKDGKTVGTITDFDMEYDIQEEVEACLGTTFQERLERLFQKSKRQHTVTMTRVKTSKSFNKQFRNLDIVKNHKVTKKTKNAYVDLTSPDFDIVKEVYGDNMNKKALKKALLKAIAENDMTFQYKASDYYVKPTITADSKEIKERREYANNFLRVKITITGVDTEYTISPTELDKMISVDGNDTISVNQKQVTKFVKSIAGKFGTVGMTRHLKLKGGKITISGGNYGSTINVKKEVKRLTEVLQKNDDAETEVVYKTPGYGESVNEDIGDFYVEVSISKQHVWCVKDGKTVVSSDLVSGNVAEGYDTPQGVFSLMYKQSPSKLEGENSDGSKYSTPVKYWMPFYDGCGFHDADWRSEFGGTIYKKNGSHGCLNMPPKQAKKLYKYVEAGMPIIVHK